MRDISDKMETPDNEVVFYDGILTVIERIEEMTVERPVSKLKATEIILDPQYDEPLSLEDIAQKYPKVTMLIADSWTRGKIYRYKNHKECDWECVGNTIGFA